MLDAWDEAEAKVAQPVALLPTSFAEALRLAATLEEEKQAVTLQLGVANTALVAAQPAIDFTATVKADDTMYDFGAATLYSFAYTSLLGQQSAIRQFVYRQRKLKMSLQCPICPM